MGKVGLYRPTGVRPRRTTPLGQEEWRKGCLSGFLQLELKIPKFHYVSPSSGRFVIEKQGSRKVLVQEAQRIAGRPVIPGTGIKGAVRTIYEILSHSCNPLARGSCRIHPRKPLHVQELCEACALFGAMGWRGRAWFSDAKEHPPDAVNCVTRRVPVAWKPRREETRGDFRFYDLGPAKKLDFRTNQLQDAPLPTLRQVFDDGAFRARLCFRDVSEVELGRLLFCLGYDFRESQGFLLRLGGLRFHGEGRVEVQPIRVQLLRSWHSSAQLPIQQTPGLAEDEAEVASPEQKVAQDEALAVSRDWQQAALKSPWAEVFLGKLEELSQRISREPGGPR